MKKYDFLSFEELSQNFILQFKNFTFLTPILSILSFCYYVILCFLFLINKLLLSLFEYLPDTKDEHVAYRIAALFVFSSIFLLKILLSGAINMFVFFFGFCYDINNTIMSFGKSEPFFMNW